MKNKLDVVGGQAVIEGVLMKSKDRYAVAVRLPNKKIRVKLKKIKPLPKILTIPFLRGITTLIQILIIGIKALTWSANQQEEEEDEKLSGLAIIGTIALSFFFVIIFFIGIPFFITKLFPIKNIFFTTIEGIIRLGIFVAYVYVISLMKDIKRVFQYHGAEHMVVHAFEAKKSLTVKNIRKFSTKHPRCGTSFIFIVLIISIIVFSLIYTEHWYYKLLWRILLLPIIAGISFEILKLAGKFRNNIVMKIISAPGLWIQNITTRKPTDRMIKVAVVALKKVLE
ncbi:MAG: DUF1385 domain-containing protein [Nanoarchaeota archaeon]|nr:DUF1385 domain-containing protein [Nanoarchaeota archaeon]